MNLKVAGPRLIPHAPRTRGPFARPRSKLTTVAAVLVAGATLLTPGTTSSASAVHFGSSRYGGTLRLVGNGDVDFFDTADAYYAPTFGLFRGLARQLYTWPTASTLAGEVNPVPDLATAMPTITNGGKTWTITIRQGADWDTSPPRQVTAADEVTGLKRLCNPASPAGAFGYYENTIVGFKAYCNEFLALKPVTVASMDKFMSTHNVPGMQAISERTVQFKLIEPASDFIDILSLDFASPVPVEELAYTPGQLGVHLVSDGPYTVKSWVPTRSIDLVRNPAWNASTDPIRKGYVNEIQVTEGVPAAVSARPCRRCRGRP